MDYLYEFTTKCAHSKKYFNDTTEFMCNYGIDEAMCPIICKMTVKLFCTPPQQDCPIEVVIDEESTDPRRGSYMTPLLFEENLLGQIFYEKQFDENTSIRWIFSKHKKNSNGHKYTITILLQD